MSDINTKVRISCRNCRTKLDASDIAPFSTVPCPQCGSLLRIPRRFDRYLLEKICGIGGMSKIYRAIDPDLGRRVAIKILDPDPDVEDQGKLFFQEAKLLAGILHPGVMPIYSSGISEGCPFLVMRYMAGGDFEKLMKHNRMPTCAQTLKILAFISETLRYLWQNYRIVHHDIKPSNILFDEKGAVQLGDFDLANVIVEGAEVQPCEEWGSPGYISPERIYSGVEDHRGDIFSFGVTIYELLTKVTPFGIKGSEQELYDRRKENNFKALSELNPLISAEFSDAVGAMLAFEPEKRPGYDEITAALAAESNRCEK
jgi:serine/threonine protein kinase